MPNSKCSKVDGAEEIFVNNHALGNVLEEAKRLEFDCIVMNNIIEQDHRFIKKLTRQMKGFKYFCSASATLDGIEVAHMIRKQQFDTSGQCPFKQFAALAE
jgi:transposase-like protein